MIPALLFVLAGAAEASALRRDAEAAVQARDGRWVNRAVREWAIVAPREALEWVQGLEETERKGLMVYEALLEAVSKLDTGAAVELVEAVPVQYGFHLKRAYVHILPRLVAEDVKKARAVYARFLERTPEEARDAVPWMARAWAEKKPADAVAFVEKDLGPEDYRRYEALLEIAAVWTSRDPKAAAQLSLRAYREQRRHNVRGRERRHAPRKDPLGNAVFAWATVDRRRAIAWVEAIEEQDLREHLRHALGLPPPKPPPPPPPSRDVSSAASPTAIKYRLIEYYGGLHFCDPDLYPVGHLGREQQRAEKIYPSIVADAAHHAAIVERLAAEKRPNAYIDAKILVFREHKRLEAVKLTPTESGYSYEMRFGQFQVSGVIENSLITEKQRTPKMNECPVCLSAETLIDAPGGPLRVTEVAVGTVVWTRDAVGRRVAAPVLRVGSSPAPADHRMVRLVLADGRTMLASASHPLAGGRTMGELHAGADLDGSRIVSAERVPYDAERTYDLLPAGDTGIYWADGIPLGSTLR